MALTRQFLCQRPRTLAGPTQGRHRIPAGRGIDQLLQIAAQGRVILLDKGPATAESSAPGFLVSRLGSAPRAEFPDTGPDGSARQARGLSDQREAPTPQGKGFAGSPMPPHPFGHHGTEQLELLADSCYNSLCVHTPVISHTIQTFKLLF